MQNPLLLQLLLLDPYKRSRHKNTFDNMFIYLFTVFVYFCHIDTHLGQKFTDKFFLSTLSKNNLNIFFINNLGTMRIASITIALFILDSPTVRSVKTIGISLILNPFLCALYKYSKKN